MKYIIMCGGHYDKWQTPRQLYSIKGERIIERTVRLLEDAGIEDIAISTDNSVFSYLNLPLLTHNNGFRVAKDGINYGYWVDAFYPIDEPVCYLFGDVVYSPEAIKKIVETPTDDIEFFASAPPFHKDYIKKWAEPLAFKVENVQKFHDCIERVKIYHDQHKFKRQPISWELWQVIKGTELNKIDYTNYTVINDYSCDVDDLSDLPKIEEKL